MSKTTTATRTSRTAANGTKPSKPKLRDAFMKRGTTWSYVIRVKDAGDRRQQASLGRLGSKAKKTPRPPATKRASKLAAVSTSSTANRHDCRGVPDEWIEAHAVEIKPKTLADYRHLIERHVKPHIGGLRLQAVRPARITKLYRDLVTSGGRDGKGLSARTVAYVHAVLRKAFGDAVRVDQLLPSNPVERAKRPRMQRSEPGKVWDGAQLQNLPRRCEGASTIRVLPPGRLHGAGGRAAQSSLARRRPGRQADHHRRFGGLRCGGAHRGNDEERPVPRGEHRRRDHPGDQEHRQRQNADRLTAGDGWKGAENKDNGHVFTTAWGEPIHPDTVSSLMASMTTRHNKANPSKSAPTRQAPRSPPHPRDTPPGRRPRPCRRRTPRPRRPVHHTPGLRTRDQRTARGGGGHLRQADQRRVERSLLANPLAKSPLA